MSRPTDSKFVFLGHSSVYLLFVVLGHICIPTLGTYLQLH